MKKENELIEFIKSHDKIRPSSWQIRLTYPGYKAMRYHKISNYLFKHKMVFLANLIHSHSYKVTGIDIGIKAKLSKVVFIDHGSGVVIGEDAVIGKNVIIYQGVTLGAKGNEKPGVKRHPTIEDDVIIGANSIILGDIVVGRGSIIAAGSVITKDVSPNSIVIQKRR